VAPIPGASRAFGLTDATWPYLASMARLPGLRLSPAAVVTCDLRAWPGTPSGCDAERMFVARDVALDIGYAAARARLVNLVTSGPLDDASAYQQGLGRLIRVGPLGDLPGGRLFLVLDGDFTLTPAGEDAARLALAGVYRPPLGRLGASLDRAVLHRVADATIRAGRDYRDMSPWPIAPAQRGS
jgi:hypothetical protein